MGKKKLDVMAKEREIFINGQVDENGNIIVPGCVRNGIDAESANKIFDEMAEFAKYAFNKSHAACYAVVAYRTAYLKTYYPAEFMAAMLNSFLGNLDKVPLYVNECKKLKVEILKPDINKSFTKFTVEDGNNIRFGLGSIKNVGINAVNTIVQNRNQLGEFKSFIDFAERISKEDEVVNKKCIESLIKAGAFDNLGETRATLIASFEEILDNISDSNKKGFNGQVSMFDMLSDNNDENKDEVNNLKYNMIVLPEYNDLELFALEKEMVGIYISGHPLSKYEDKINKIATINSLNIRETESSVDEENGDLSQNLVVNSEYKDGDFVSYCGIITSIKKKYTKTNKIMAFVTIEDLFGQTEVIIFENTYLKISDVLKEENIVVCKGRLSIRPDEKTSIIASSIELLDNAKVEVKKEIKEEVKEVKKTRTSYITITDLDEEKKEKLRNILRGNRPQSSDEPINIEIINGDRKDPAGQIISNDSIFSDIKSIVGEDNFIIFN